MHSSDFWVCLLGVLIGIVIGITVMSWVLFPILGGTDEDDD